MNFEEEKIKLVNKLKREGRIYSKEIELAFLRINRELFIPKSQERYAYVDSPLQIGEGQTISAPHMVAIMCEKLDIKKGQKILEIGSGSGYHSAIVSEIVGKKGHVYTIERFSSLAKFAKKNLEKAKIDNVTVEVGDGSEGLPNYAPYSRIYVTCASPDIPPPLIDQIKDKGKILIPVGKMICELQLIIKNKEKLSIKNLGGCAFVPLIGKYGH